MRTEEIQAIWAELSVEHRRLLLEFARFLLHDEDQCWESILDDPKPRPRLDAFLRESALEVDSRRANP